MTPETPSGCLPADVPSVALFGQALDACSHRHGLPSEDILRLLEEGEREIHSSFRYGLAKALCGYLAGLGPIFHEVYIYGSSVQDASNPASDIDVIVVVQERRDEVSNLLRKLNLSLSAQYRRLVGLKTEPAFLLDVHVIDVEEQGERCGFGALLHGLHTRPICLWRSDPARTGVPREGNPRRSAHTSSGSPALIER